MNNINTFNSNNNSSNSNSISNSNSNINNKSLWTSKKEKLLNFWKEESRIYSWLHEQNSKYYRELDKKLSIPSLLISAVTSTALFSSINMENNEYVIVSFGILLVIGTFLQSIRDFLGVPDLIHKNAISSDVYLSIVNDIEEQLTRERSERDNAKQFVQKIKTRKTDILKTRVTIGDKLWKRLKNSINNGDVVNLYSNDFFKNYLEKVNDDDPTTKDNKNEKKWKTAITSVAKKNATNNIETNKLNENNSNQDIILNKLNKFQNANSINVPKTDEHYYISINEETNSNPPEKYLVLDTKTTNSDITINIDNLNDLEIDKKNKKPTEVRKSFIDLGQNNKLNINSMDGMDSIDMDNINFNKQNSKNYNFNIDNNSYFPIEEYNDESSIYDSDDDKYVSMELNLCTKVATNIASQIGNELAEQSKKQLQYELSRAN